MKLFSKKEANTASEIEIKKLSLDNSILREYITKNKIGYKEEDTLGISADIEKKNRVLLEEYKKRKNNMLQELNILQREINKRKDVIFGLIEKQDELDERERVIQEKEVGIKDKEKYINNILK